VKEQKANSQQKKKIPLSSPFIKGGKRGIFLPAPPVSRLLYLSNGSKMLRCKAAES
jgi:hypothetical protein